MAPFVSRDSHPFACTFLHTSLYTQRLEGGLFNLQQVSIILAYACIFDTTCLKKAVLRLGSEDSNLEDVLDTLRDMLLTLHSADEEGSGESSGGEVKVGGDSSASGSSSGDGKSSVDKVVESEYKQVITEWCAALSAIVDQLEA